MSYDVDNFEVDVLQASHKIPVLVDFWAEWCGPCRILGPVLEKLAAEQEDRWKLVKVDTDRYSEVSAQYGIRGIPNVKLFVDGQVSDEFTGALPEYAVRQWLDTAIPSKFHKDIASAKVLLAEGNTTEASPLLEHIVNNEPANNEARALLARAIVFRDPGRATTLVQDILADSSSFDVAEGIRTFSHLSALRSQPDALPDAEVKELYLQAVDAIADHDFDAALEKFIAVIRKDRYYDDDGSRKACIAVFKVLGEEHEVTLRHRREFDHALFA